MKVRNLVAVMCLGWTGISCGSGEPDPDSLKVSTDAAGAQKAVGKISEVAMQAYFARIQAAAREYVATRGSSPTDIRQLVEAGLLHEGQANDPWGNPYVLKTDAGVVTVISYGADGRPGGTEGNRDRISSN